MAPKIAGIAETILYAADIAVTGDWYERVLGIGTIFQESDRLRALQVSAGRVLLLFKEGASTAPATVSGGTIPAHDGSGPAHIAFAMETEDVQLWENHLRENAVPVESLVRWADDAISLYFRDPDDHLVELVSSGSGCASRNGGA